MRRHGVLPGGGRGVMGAPALVAMAIALVVLASQTGRAAAQDTAYALDDTSPASTDSGGDLELLLDPSAQLPAGDLKEATAATTTYSPYPSPAEYNKPSPRWRGEPPPLPSARRSPPSPPAPRQKKFETFPYKKKWIIMQSTRRFNASEAARFCAQQGFNSPNFLNPRFREAEQELCYYNGKGCWLGGRVGAYCPVMAPDQNGLYGSEDCGNRHYALCYRAAKGPWKPDGTGGNPNGVGLFG
eukprot:XP_001692594.1 predicted protein [Chlamydomonas reinhardtii]